jgi:hypothetical protein
MMTPCKDRRHTDRRQPKVATTITFKSYDANTDMFLVSTDLNGTLKDIQINSALLYLLGTAAVESVFGQALEFFMAHDDDKPGLLVGHTFTNLPRTH